MIGPSQLHRLQRLLVPIVALSVVFVFGCPVVPPGNGEPNEPEPNQPAPPGNGGLTGKYVGSTRCSLCHVNIHANWSDTIHASALEALEAIGQGTNANCIGCHTVGFGEDGGFVDRATTNDLAGVGCEACHGPGRDHADNVSDASLRPPVNIAAEVCGVCHTGAHHPNYDEWAESGHAGIDDHVAEGLVEGGRVNSCGICHSGDAFYLIQVKGEEVPDDALEGLDPNDLNAITCAVCHNPHMRTGNAYEPDDDRDYQLRYPEVKPVVPKNTPDDPTDRTRFNLCGQCHHSRGRDWTATSRGPHHSVQSNVYVGEMPTPEGEAPLVFSRVSPHLGAPAQCATCHMHRVDFESEEAPAIAGHTFEPNFDGCVRSGCHPSAEGAEARFEVLEAEMEGRIQRVLDLLGDPADWEYSSAGGPAEDPDPNDPNALLQSDLSDAVLQARFLIKYVEYDGSHGLHNPDYVRDMLQRAEFLLVAP